MLKKIISICTILLSLLGLSLAQASDLSKAKERLVLKPGDIIVQPEKNGWAAIKILAIDQLADGTAAAHCLTYNPVPDKPTVASLKLATVMIWHAPIDAASFSTGWERIGNQAPTQRDLAGFIEYLKLTDFPRYITFTGQASKAIMSKARDHYIRANALADQGKREQAITVYGEAIALFPLFYEAIDNRAFTYMELGKNREALNDFEQSLRVYPNGMAAFFSKGECLMKLGELKAAEAIFREGQNRFPEKRAMFAQFLERVQALQKK